MKNINRRSQQIILFLSVSLIALLTAAAADAQMMTNIGDTIFIKNNTVLQVNGSFSNTDNSGRKPYIYNDGILRVDSNFSAPKDMIYKGTDTFQASGTGAQNIAGLSFYNLMIANGGQKTITSNAYIRHLLIVTNGTLETGTDTIQLDSTASMTEDSVNAVFGNVKMKKYLAANSSYLFGNIGFDITTSAPIPGMTSIVRVTGGGATMYAHGASSVARFFDVTPQNDKRLNASIRFHYYGTELNGLSRGDLALYSSENKGTTWNYSGYTARTPGNNHIERNGVDSFSRWTLAGISMPLPVHLIEFTATPANNDVKLFWATASEENNDHFDIERSLNGHEWEKIGKIAGSGTSFEQHTYSFIDYNAIILGSDIIYYRLKQVDYNGARTFSPIRKVLFNSFSTDESIKVWYNSSEEQAYITFNADNGRPANLTAVNMQGKLIARQAMNINQGVNQFSLDLSTLPAGIYSITLSDNSGVWTKKIVKY